MIDMSKLYEHINYQDSLNHFNTQFINNDCDYIVWSIFKGVHLFVSNYKCPICECSFEANVQRLTNSGGNTTIKPTIDHYRPKNYYSFLKCDHKNYLLMCSECNNLYKGNTFPLHVSTPNRAQNKSEISNEKSLIINPITDNIYDLLELIFKRTNSGKEVLELAPLSSLDNSSYEYEKAVETIKIFGLYDCDNNRHQNENVHNCRIDILQTHFGIFYNFAKALKEQNREEVALSLKEYRTTYEQYGFFEFIKKGQFKIDV